MSPYPNMLAGARHDALPGSGRLPLFLSWSAQAVPARLYAELDDGFPSSCRADPPTPAGPDATHTDYARLRVRPGEHSHLPPAWREFWDYAYGDFLRDLLGLWHRELHVWYPGLRAKNMTVEGQYAYRLPAATDAGLPPHCDSPTTLFALLWYFRHPDDAAAGGDLAFLRRTEGSGYAGLLTVPYAANHLALFLNGPTAVHAVGTRTAASLPRRHVRLLVNVPKGEDLFPCLRAGDMVGDQPGVGVTLYGPARATKAQRRHAAARGEELARAVQARWQDTEW